MEVARLLEKTAREVIDQIDAVKKPVDDELLKHVAVVSAGDKSIGHMIADVIDQIGIDGGVTVEDFAGIGIYNELVDGFYFRKGFTNVNLTNDPTNLVSQHQDVDIFITEKRMATAADIAPILEKIISMGGTGKDLVLVGDVSEEAQALLMLNRLKGIINVAVVDVPVFGAMRSLTLEDLALVTGGKVYTAGANPGDFEITMLGGAAKVVINEFSTAIIGGDAASEDVEARVSELREQLAESDADATVEAIKGRLARLTGKVAIIRVGGATEVEQGEVKLRVQDAVCAVQAAIRDGIVPGGGVMLARSTPKYFEDSFQKPFVTLVENMGYNSDKAIWTLLQSDDIWEGYDLKSSADLALIDMLEAGIIDPASVVKEVVQNATSVVAKLITVSVGVTFKDRDQKHD